MYVYVCMCVYCVSVVCSVLCACCVLKTWEGRQAVLDGFSELSYALSNFLSPSYLYALIHIELY